MAFRNPQVAQMAAAVDMNRAVAEVLRSDRIGEHSSDHKQEAKSYQGSNYMAIAALGRTSATAIATVYAKGDQQTSTVRKSYRKAYGAAWKTFAKSHSDEGATDTVPDDHWVAKLVAQPNPTTTAGLFLWEFMQQLHLHGRCLIFNRPTSDYSQVAERYIVPMAITEPVFPGMDARAPNGGVRIFAYSAGLGFNLNPIIRSMANCVIPIEDLSIVGYPDPVLRGDGRSPTDAAGWWIDTGLMVDMARWKQLKRGPRPHGIVNVEGDDIGDKELDAVEKRLNRKLGDSEYDERVIAVGNAVSVPSEATPVDMDYVNSSDQLQANILAVHGASKASVGLTESMTYGSLAAEHDRFASVVESDLQLLADDYTKLAKECGECIEVQYDVPPFNNPDLQEQQLERDLQAGIRTGKEWRAIRGLPPFGDWRDNARVTAQGFVDDAGQPITSAPSAPSDPAAARMASIASNSQASVLTPIKLVDNGVPEPIAKSYRKPTYKLSDQAPIVAVDLDGTLADESMGYDPHFIGEPILERVADLCRLKDAGCQIVVFTCRDDDELIMGWLDAHGIPWDAINAQPEGFEGSGKVLASVYWDNRAMNADCGLHELVKRLPEGQVKQRLIESTKPEKERLGVIMLEMPSSVCSMVGDLQLMISPESLREDGLEDWPHVTLLYGIVGASAKEVIEAVRRIDQMDIQFGQVTAFFNESAVLKVDVESAQLRKANERLRGALPVMETWPDYCPHMTLAYVDPLCEQALMVPYECSLTGKTARITHAVVSMAGQRYRVPLRATDNGGLSTMRFDAANKFTENMFGAP